MPSGRCALGVLLACAASVCLAEDPVLETIAVQATRAQDVPGKAAIVDAVTVKAIGATHPAELLDRVPGVWVSRGGGQEHLTALRSPVWTGPGSCGEVLFAEDGVPVRPSGFCNVNQLIELNTEQAGGIEVLRGTQGGALYGANAVHGVFNVLSQSLQPQRSLRLEGGPNDYARGMWQQGDEEGYLAVNGTHDGGYQDSSGFDQQKLTWKQQQALSNVVLTHTLNAVHLDQQSIGYLEGDDAYKDEHRRRDNSKPDAYRDVDALRYVQSWDWHAGDYRYSIKPYLRHTAMDFTQHFVFPEALEENGHHSGGMQWLMASDDQGWGNWQLGAEGEVARAWTREWQEEPSTPSSPQGIHYDYDVGMQTAALWQELTWHVTGQLDGQFGLRADRVLYDYHNKTLSGAAGKFMRPADRDDRFSLMSPRIGLVFTDHFDNEWYASVSRANRAPQTAELYRLQGTQKSADIDAEVADGGELGWRGRLEQPAGTTQWNVALFDMHKDQVIIRNANSVLSDDARTQHRGIEIGVQQDWVAGWFVNVAATYAEHRYNSDVFDRSVSVDGNMIDTAPRTLGSMQAGWQQSATRVALEWQHVGRYYLNPEDTFDYEGHNLLHLRVQHRVTDDWLLFARLMNVTDQDYAERADVTAFPVVEPRYFVGLPRSLYMGFEWSY